MKSRPKWSHVVAALGVIAALAIAAPALGLSKSIRKAIKAEVSKQIGDARGPSGPRGKDGAPGSPGAPGAPGTARAYGLVNHSCDATTTVCELTRSKGIGLVTRPFPGIYCIFAPGIDPRTVAPSATVDEAFTSSADAVAMIRSDSAECQDPGVFEVITGHPTTNNFDNTIGFTIVIP